MIDDAPRALPASTPKPTSNKTGAFLLSSCSLTFFSLIQPLFQHTEAKAAIFTSDAKGPTTPPQQQQQHGNMGQTSTNVQPSRSSADVLTKPSQDSAVVSAPSKATNPFACKTPTTTTIVKSDKSLLEAVQGSCTSPSQLPLSFMGVLL
jgi:hypothetical protein